MVVVVKNLPANSGDLRDACLIPGSGISPGGGHDKPIPAFLPGEPHEQRRAWWVTVHNVAELDTTELN